jgi:hypothetical protein
VASSTAVLINPETGERAEVPMGFSWTTFFFGPFPALFRGDIKWAGIIFGVGLITFGISNFVFCFLYNKYHLKEKISNGWKAESNAAKVARYGGFNKSRIEYSDS